MSGSLPTDRNADHVSADRDLHPVVPDGTGVPPAAFGGGFAGVASVQPHPTGLTFHDPNMPYAQWAHVGQQLWDVRDWTAFAIGDWLLAGEGFYGEEAYQAVEEIRSKETIQNYVRVARKFEPSRRRLRTLSHTHHLRLAALPPDEADAWLDEAEQEGWSAALMDEERKKRSGAALSISREAGGRIEDAVRAVLGAVDRAEDGLHIPSGSVERFAREFIADVEQRYEDLVEALAKDEVKPPGVVAKRNARNAKLARRGRPTKPTLTDEARVHARREVERLLRTSNDPGLRRLAADLKVADRLRDLLVRDDELMGKASE